MDEATAAFLRTGVTLALSARGAEIVRAFHDREIRPILLKGPALERLYSDEPRFYSDIDLLVAPADFRSAEMLLESLGFAHGSLDEIPHDRPAHAHMWSRSDGMRVDLHRTLVGVGVGPEEFWRAVAGETTSIQFGDTSTLVFADAGQAMHLALHAAQDGVRHERPLEDLRRAIEQTPEEVWKDAAALARRVEAVDAFAAGLRTVASGRELAGRLGLPFPRDVATSLRARGVPGEVLGLDWLLRTPGARTKLQLVKAKLFPSAEFLRAWTPLARKGLVGMSAARVWRILWLAAKVPRAGAAWFRAHREVQRRSADERQS